MILDIKNKRIIIFYFLQPDKHGNLILRKGDMQPTSTNRYILEEYYPSSYTTKSFITPSWTGVTKKIIWKTEKIKHQLQYSKNDRKSNLFQILLKIFGYNDNTHPTLDKIIKSTQGHKDGMKFDEDIWIKEEIIKDYYKTSKNDLKKKNFIPLLQTERLLLTEGKFEENSYTISPEKKRLLKPEIKKNLTKIKCRCK